MCRCVIVVIQITSFTLSQLVLDSFLIAKLLDELAVGLIKVGAVNHVKGLFHEDVACLLEHGRDQKVLVQRYATADASRRCNFGQ